MLKKLIALFLCLLLVVSFAACKKDNNEDNPSSQITNSDPTQDYENDIWDDGSNLTEEEKQEIEDLWNDLVQNGGAEIKDPDESSSSKTSGTSSKQESNDTSNEFNDESSSAASSSSKNSSSKPTSSKIESSSAVSSSSKPASSNNTTTTSSQPANSGNSDNSNEEDKELNAEIEVSRPAIW